MGLVQLAEAATVANPFGAEQITAITSALTSAINNIVNIYISLLPIFALICGVGFGIRFITKLFRQTKNGN